MTETTAIAGTSEPNAAIEANEEAKLGENDESPKFIRLSKAEKKAVRISAHREARMAKRKKERVRRRERLKNNPIQTVNLDRSLNVRAFTAFLSLYVCFRSYLMPLLRTR